jgi:hypothetical protein
MCYDASLRLLQQQFVEPPLQAVLSIEILEHRLSPGMTNRSPDAFGVKSLPLIAGDTEDGLLTALASGSAPSHTASAVYAWLCSLNLPTSKAKKLKLAKQSKFPLIEVPLWLAAVKLCGLAAVSLVATASALAAAGDLAEATQMLPESVLIMWTHVRNIRSYLDAQHNALGLGEAVSAAIETQAAANMTEGSASSAAPTLTNSGRNHVHNVEEVASDSGSGVINEEQSISDSEGGTDGSSRGHTMPGELSAAQKEARDAAAAAASGRLWGFATEARQVAPLRATSFEALQVHILQRLQLILSLDTNIMEGVVNGRGTGTNAEHDEAIDKLECLQSKLGTGGARKAYTAASAESSSGLAIEAHQDAGNSILPPHLH